MGAPTTRAAKPIKQSHRRPPFIVSLAPCMLPHLDATGRSTPAQAQCHFKQHRVLVNTVGEETPAVFGKHEWSDATEPARKRRYPQHRNLRHSSRKHANFPGSMNFTPMIPKGLGRTGFQLRGSEVAFAQKADLGLDNVGVAAHAHGAAMICTLPLAWTWTQKFQEDCLRPDSAHTLGDDYFSNSLRRQGGLKLTAELNTCLRSCQAGICTC